MRYLVKALREPDGVISVLFDAADEADAARQARAQRVVERRSLLALLVDVVEIADQPLAKLVGA